MTTAAQLISKLGAKGIKLWLDEQQQLRFKAPKNALDSALKEQLLALKPEIIAFLHAAKQPSLERMQAIVRDEISLQEGYPLSFSQQRFWFLDRLEPGDPSLHIPASLAIDGPLDIQRLNQAFNALCQKHESLRTFFQHRDNNVSQVIAVSSSWNIKEDDDLSDVSAERLRIRIEEIMRDQALKAFDLNVKPSSKSPFFRVRLARLHKLNTAAHAQRHMLFLCLHHIIADGLSISIIIRELAFFYSALKNQQSLSVSPAKIQYIDYAAWQHQWMQSPQQQLQLDYWQQQLHGLEILNLPCDFPRPKQLSHRGANISKVFSPSLQQSLQALSASMQVSYFSLLLSAFNILLMRYSGQDDICVGTPVAGRQHAEIQDSIGCFINLLSLRSRLQPEQSLQSLALAVQKTLLDAQQHQDIPFDIVAEQCTTHRSLAHTPIFQVLFTLQNSSLATLFDFDELHIELLPQASIAAKYDLQLHIDNNHDELSCNIEYNRDLFSAASMQSFMQQFEQLLQAIVATPEQAIGRLNIFSNDEKLQLTQKAPRRNTEQSLHQLLEQQALNTPDNIAVNDGRVQLSYKDLHQQANALAALLQSQGIGAGQQVGIYLAPTATQITALLAVIKTGACYVPMDANYPEERLQHIANNAQLSCVLSETYLLSGLDFNCPSIALNELQLKPQATAPTISTKDSDRLYLIYTSGSTGLPKGASVSYGNEMNLLPWYVDSYGMNSDSKVLLISSFGFDLTQKNLLAPLITGAEIHFTNTDGYDPTEICDVIWQRKINWLNCAPSAFYPLVAHCQRIHRLNYLSPLRQVFFGGESIQIPALQPWLEDEDYHCSIINMYGPTECTDIATTHTVDTAAAYANNIIPIGKAIDGVACYVLDSQQQLLPFGATGELYIGGDSVGQGYFADTVKTQENFLLDPFRQDRRDALMYRTHDLVRYVHHQGESVLEFIARADDQVKIRGFRVELGEISNQILRHPNINAAVVIHLQQNQENRLIAYMVSEKTQKPDLSELRKTLSASLPDYMIPSAFVYIDAIPLSANGKVNKQALPQPQESDFIKAVFVAPGTLLEVQLAQLFTRVLQLTEIGIYDNFFELGGHSLLATQLVGYIADEFGIEIPLRSFFQQASVAQLAQHIQAGDYIDAFAEQSTITLIDRTAEIPLSLAQERLWIIEQLNPGSSAYNIPMALHLRGNLHIAALNKSLNEIVSRHESLRTRFSSNSDGAGLQIIDDADTFSLNTINLAEDVTPGGGFTQAQILFNQEAQRAFNIQSDALFRASLVVISPTEHVLICCMHHLVADGWSMTILQKEFVELYAAYSKDMQAESPLPILPHQYADFAVWQRQLLSDDHVQQHLDFWLEKLAGAPKLLQLKTDQPRPAQQSFNGAMAVFPMADALSHNIRVLSQQLGSTHFTILLSAFALLLHKHSAQTDICIGTPVAGREKSSLQQLIGFFVNAVVLRCDLTGNPSFIELLERMQDVSLAAFSHQDIPIEKILENLSLPRDLSHAPITQVGFSYISKEFASKSQLSGLDVDYLDFEHLQAKYDITLIIIDEGEGFSLHFEYNRDLFAAASIELMHTHFCRILEQCLADSQLTIKQCSLLNKQELYQALTRSEDDTQAILPLTAMQHDLVASQFMQPQSLANTLGYRAEIDIDVDPDAWRQALENLAAEENIMRSEFLLNPLSYGDFAYQAINAQQKISLNVIDKRSDDCSAENINAWVNAFIYQPEAYLQAEFIRYGLLQLTDNKTILLMSAHHGLLDGIAVVLIATATARHYEALLTDTALSTKQPFNANFHDYIASNQQIIDNSRVTKFWQIELQRCQALSFSLATLEKKQAQAIKTHAISPEHWRAIKSFCRRNRSTPAQYFKILYGILIQQYCSADADFFLTEFKAGRSKDFAMSLGCFFQQTPFIVDSALFNTGDIGELFSYTKEFRKKIKPFDNISASLSHALSKKHSSHHGLNFMYNFYHFFPTDEKMLGESIRCIEMPPFVENTVQLVIKEHEDNASIDLYYPEAVFRDFEFLSRLDAISAQFIQGTEKISDLSFLLDEEYAQQLLQFNPPETATPAGPSLAQQFEQRVTDNPNAIAVIDAEQELSFGELNSKANQLAHYLKLQAIGKDSRIAIYMQRNCEALIAILACVKLGAAYIPIDSSQPVERLQYILASSHASLCISQAALRESLDNSPCPAIYFAGTELLDITLADYGSDNLNIESSNQDMLYIIFTSGSTGKPKGAAVSLQGELNLLHWYLQSAEFSSDSRCLIISALGFDLSQKNLFAPLLAGGAVVLNSMPHYDSQHILALIDEQKISHINCAPSAFYPLVEDHQSPEKLASLRQLIFGGEAIQLERLSAWLESEHFNAQITNHYGPTECTDIALYQHIENPVAAYKQDIPLGKPNSGVQVYLMNDNLQLLPVGLSGEICIAGNGVGLGYLDQDELNNEKFLPNPFGDGQLYKTGDLACYHSDGAIHFIGRKDFQVKLHGLRIELGEIEHALRQISGVDDALALVSDERIVAYALADTQLNSNDWPVQLAEYLPSYMIPQAFMLLDKWPLNNNGKIDRARLPEVASAGTQVEFVAARDATEEAICAIIERVLQIPRVGIYDNFFDLGGHSLAASRAIVQIREHFAIEIPLNLLFDMTTVEKLAAFIKASQWAKQSSAIKHDEENRDTGFI